LRLASLRGARLGIGRRGKEITTDPQIPAGDNSGTKRANDFQSEGTKGPSVPGIGWLNDSEHPSSDETTVRRLVSHLSRVPDVRQEQVNALRSEIESGQFQRGNDVVAGAVLAELFGTRSSG
jgi:hypothetical protein